MKILITDIADSVDRNEGLVRHSRADGNPEKNEAKDWIPACLAARPLAFAGMTFRRANQ